MVYMIALRKDAEQAPGDKFNQQHAIRSIGMYEECYFSKKIWQINFHASTLRQFFVIHLSRKAEGYGPTTPWQPEMCLKSFKGANSIPTCGRER